jgi:hypothetical protein
MTAENERDAISSSILDHPEDAETDRCRIMSAPDHGQSDETLHAVGRGGSRTWQPIGAIALRLVEGLK